MSPLRRTRPSRRERRRLLGTAAVGIVLGIVLSLGVLALLLVPAPAADAQDDPPVRVTVDRNRVPLGEPIYLNITIRGSRDARPQLPDLSAFRVRNAGEARQIQTIQGRASVSVTYTYVLFPKAAGTFTIDTVSVELDGRTFRSAPFQVQVLANDATPQDDDRKIFVTAQVSDANPYIGEQLIFTFRFYLLEDGRQIQLASQPQLRPVNYDGFTVETLGEVRNYSTTLEGRPYSVSEIRQALFPQEEGTLTVPSWELVTEVVERSTRRRRTFGDFFGRAERKILRTRPIEVEVRPLPPAPADYSGLVGSFNVQAELRKRQLKVGESATLELSVRGSGNVGLISEPTLPPLPEFKIYDDKPSSSIDKDGDRLRGRKTYRKALVPLVPGELTIPALTVTYFDPDAERYRTTETQPLTLEVAPGDGEEDLGLTEFVTAGGGKVSVKILANDILPIYRGLDAVASPATPWSAGSHWASAFWVAGFSLPILGFLAFWWRERRQDVDHHLLRARTARKQARAPLREARAQLEAGDSGAGGPEATGYRAAAQTASRALRAYIGDKLHAEGTALTPTEAAGLLQQAGLDDEDLLREVRRDLEALDATQYGAGLDAGGVQECLDRLPTLLDRLEAALRGRTPSTRGSVARALALGAGVLLLGAPVAVQAQDVPPTLQGPPPTQEAGTPETPDTPTPAAPSTPSAPEASQPVSQTSRLPVPAAPKIDAGQLFVQANTAYEAGNAVEAVRLYEQLVDASHRDGRLLYNLANAYLRSSQLGDAIATYRQAHSLLPRDQDILANLDFARQSTKDDIAPPTASTALRTLFFWHYSLSVRELAWIVLVLNLLFWSALALRRRRLDSEILRWTVTGLLALLLAGGGSLAAHTLFPAKVAVVLPVEVEAKSGTSVDAVVRFKLHAGTEVEVVEQRPGWVRIALPDGQQGWIEEAGVAVVGF